MVVLFNGFYGKGGEISTSRRDEKELEVYRCTCCRAAWFTSTR
jgi:hypothetical protein